MANKVSGFGKWNKEYANVKIGDTIAWVYGSSDSYRIGAKFLKDCKTVEDWGCGLGHFKRFRKTGYIGLDGSKTPFADKIVDLAKCKRSCEGIFMRHVLEHNINWKKILENALESCSKKMCLIIFTRFSERTKVIADSVVQDINVPDISFSKKELDGIITKYGTFSFTEISTRTQYWYEAVYKIIKNK